MYGVKRVRIGRQAATPLNCKDVSSQYARWKNGIRLQRIDHLDPHDDSWQQLVVEDRQATPADVVRVRIDFSDWLQTLPSRTRRIAETLSTGETTQKTANRFRLSPSRISQLRRELQESWQEFVGDTRFGATVSAYLRR